MKVGQQHQTGRKLALEETDAPMEQKAKAPVRRRRPDLNLSAAAFTTYYRTANGVHPSVNFANANVKANSRVLLNISEYAATPQDRFIGSARM